MRERHAEVVVIGSGPGGAVAASLCADAGYSVLMLEEGSDLPLESAPHFSPDELIQKYRGGGVGIAFGRDPLAYVEGRCIGGGSEVNRGLYHRSPGELLERWSSEFKVRELSTSSLATSFDECEKRVQVQYLPAEPPESSAKLRDGAEALGWRAIEAPRLYSYTARQGAGRKQSMSETLVPRFRAAGGEVVPNCRARSIRREGGKWMIEAVETHASNSGSKRLHRFSADALFVACGAVQTPVLLRRSGLRHNIGNSLRFHPMLKLVAEFDEDVNRPGDLDPVHQVKHFEPDLGMGCSIANPSTVGMALSSTIEGRGVDLQRKWRQMGVYYVQGTVGRAKVRTIPWSLDPLVSIGFEAAEKKRMLEGLALLARLMFAAGARVVYPSLSGCPPLTSLKEVERLEVAKLAPGSLSSVHVFSSCPMGEDLTRCATDSFGKVHGAEGLYIMDSSVLCTPTSVNPQGTVMAIAHRNASRALANRFR